MKLGALFSGGKDSTYGVYLAKKQGHEISCLITVYSENKASYMFHTPSISQVEKQARAMNLPLIEQKTKGEKEAELIELEKAIKKAVKEYDIEGVITGAVESDYQASRIQKICNKLGVEVFNPIWHRKPKEYWQEMLDLGFRIIIVGVAAEGLGKEWLGREIDETSLDKLERLSRKYKFHLGFEGGEAETFVLDSPLFSKKLEVEKAEKIWKENSGVYEIKKIKMSKKQGQKGNIFN